MQFFEIDGVHLSHLGYRRLVAQLNTLVPALASAARAAAEKAAVDAARAEAEAEAAIVAARSAQKLLLDSKIDFSKAKKETAVEAKANAAAAAEDARVAAIEYQYWSEAVNAARVRSASEVLQAGFRARLARASGLASLSVGAAAREAKMRASIRDRAVMRPPNAGQQGEQVRFGLWTRKRCWAAGVLQRVFRTRLARRLQMYGVCVPCDPNADAEKMAKEAADTCHRCGGTGHWARACTRAATWRENPSIAREAKLRLRTLREQRVDDSGVVRYALLLPPSQLPLLTRFPGSAFSDLCRYAVRVDARLFVAPVFVPMERPAKLRLHVLAGGKIAIELTARSYREERESREERGGKTRLCRWYDRHGECNRGERCPYAHGLGELTPEARLEEEERRSNFQPSVPMREPQRLDELYGQYKTSLCEQWSNEGVRSSSFLESITFMRPSTQTPSPKRAIHDSTAALEWLSFILIAHPHRSPSPQRCDAGAACLYAHGEDELQKSRRGLSERDIFRIEQMARQRMCRKWQTTGSCPNGAACLYAHGEAQVRGA